MSPNEVLRRTGDVLQIANPLAGLWLAAKEGKRNDYFLSYIETLACVGIGKYLGRKLHYAGSMRPDRTSFTGMPSGHTASAWISAARTRNPVLYGTAAITGVSRITNKRHYWYQVLVSIMASEGVVILNDKLKNKVWLDARLENNKYNFNVRYLI